MSIFAKFIRGILVVVA